MHRDVSRCLWGAVEVLWWFCSIGIFRVLDRPLTHVSTFTECCSARRYLVIDVGIAKCWFSKKITFLSRVSNSSGEGGGERTPSKAFSITTLIASYWFCAAARMPYATLSIITISIISILFTIFSLRWQGATTGQEQSLVNRPWSTAIISLW